MGLFRVLLALSVLAAHSQYSGFLQGFGGDNAVEVFFVISGFYIATILTQGYVQIKYFYLNRILRLYPIYYLVLSASMVLYLFTSIYNNDFSRFTNPWPLVLFAISANLVILGSDLTLFMEWNQGILHFGSFANSEIPIHRMLLVPQVWTISLEILFYAIAPWLMRLRNSWLIFICLFSLSAKILFLSLVSNSDPWTYRFFPFEVHLFVLGILLFRFSNGQSFKNKISKRNIYLFGISLYISIGLARSLWEMSRYFWLLVLLLFLFVAITMSGPDSKDKKLGEYSYPIYISHILVIELCYLLTSRISVFVEIIQSSVIRFALSIIGTFLLSKALLLCTRKIELKREQVRHLAGTSISARD